MPIFGPLPSDVVDRIRELYLAGEKVEVIAIECETSAHTVEKYVADLPRRRPHLEARRLRAIELANEGMRIDEIARELTCSIRFVRAALTPPPPEPPSEEEKAAAIELGRRERNAKRRAQYAVRKQRLDAMAKAMPS